MQNPQKYILKPIEQPPQPAPMYEMIPVVDAAEENEENGNHALRNFLIMLAITIVIVGGMILASNPIVIEIVP